MARLDGPDTAPPRHDLASLYWQMLDLRPDYPGGELIRIRPDWRDKQPPSGPAARLFTRHLQSARSLLDVGAGDRYWQGVLENMGVAAAYRSADLDTRHEHDYRDFLTVDDRFDAILMLELLEHLPLDLGLSFLDHAERLLNPGGCLVIGTPNTHHAHQVWSADFTHIRPWPAHDLWAVCKLLGFSEVSVYRQFLTSGKRALIAPIQFGLSRILGIDPAYGLVVFARKPTQAESQRIAT